MRRLLMVAASRAEGLRVRWWQGLACLCLAFPALAAEPSRSASVREVLLTPREQRKLLRSASIPLREGVEVRLFRCLGKNLQFTAEIGADMGGKPVEVQTVAMHHHFQEQKLLLVLDPPTSSKPGRLILEPIESYGVLVLLQITFSSAIHADVPSSWAGWAALDRAETPNLTPAVVSPGQTVTLLEWRAASPRQATLVLKAKLLGFD
jgi:hypothetical protein